MSEMLIHPQAYLYDRANQLFKCYIHMMKAIDEANKNEIPFTAPALIFVPYDSLTPGPAWLDLGHGVQVYPNTDENNLIRVMLHYIYDKLPKLNRDSYTEDPSAAVADNLTYTAIAAEFVKIVERSIGVDTKDRTY